MIRASVLSFRPAFSITDRISLYQPLLQSVGGTSHAEDYLSTMLPPPPTHCFFFSHSIRLSLFYNSPDLLHCSGKISLLSPLTVAENSFAGCNYFDYILLVIAFTLSKAFHTFSVRLWGQVKWLLLQLSADIRGLSRDTEYNTALDYGYLLSC